MLGNIVPLSLSLWDRLVVCVLLYNMHICPTLVVQVSSFMLFAHLASNQVRIASKSHLKIISSSQSRELKHNLAIFFTSK